MGAIPNGMENGTMNVPSYYMAAYTFPTYLPYTSCSTSAYFESRTIQQALIEKSTQHGQVLVSQGVNTFKQPSRKKGETLVASERKLPDGRAFPSDYEKDSLR